MDYDTDDYIRWLVNAVESAAHEMAGADDRKSANDAEVALKTAIDKALTAAYVDGCKYQRERDAKALDAFVSSLRLGLA